MLHNINEHNAYDAQGECHYPKPEVQISFHGFALESSDRRMATAIAAPAANIIARQPRSLPRPIRFSLHDEVDKYAGTNQSQYNFYGDPEIAFLGWAGSSITLCHVVDQLPVSPFSRISVVQSPRRQPLIQRNTAMTTPNMHNAPRIGSCLNASIRTVALVRIGIAFQDPSPSREYSLRESHGSPLRQHERRKLQPDLADERSGSRTDDTWPSRPGI